jgi:hypothetical protein
MGERENDGNCDRLSSVRFRLDVALGKLTKLSDSEARFIEVAKTQGEAGRVRVRRAGACSTRIEAGRQSVRRVRRAARIRGKQLINSTVRLQSVTIAKRESRRCASR